MANVICLICLRTDITAVNISTELADFIDELCDFNIIDNPRYKYCTICAHLLKKFYIFKQKCLKACKILKSIKGKFLPTNLHEQIPSSIGLCSSSARYQMTEHQHNSDTDLLETKPDPNIEPSVTPNNIEANNQKLETTDPILPDIEVKDEPVHDLETMKLVDDENIYTFTTSDDYMLIENKFEEQAKIITLQANEELDNNTNKDTKQSKINDFLNSFQEDLKDFSDDSIDNEDAIEVKDTTFMLSNDPLRDDESLNSMDDIKSDLSDVESLPSEEENDSESDPEIKSLCAMLEKGQNKKIKVNEIEELELAETLLKIDKKNKVLKRRVKFLRNKGSVKDCLLRLFVNDAYDLGDIKISKEVFLKIYDRFEKSSSNHLYNYKLKDIKNKKKTNAFLRYIYKLYNPEYATVFDIEYLDTEEKKLQEFNQRKERPEYVNAPLKCTRCYKGFHIEGLYDYHLRRHDESSGSHECHICAVRHVSAERARAHIHYCHSAVYVCRLCHVSYHYFSSMLNHFNLHKGVEFPCSICNGIYRSEIGLANHKRTHVTSHICTSCAKSFVSAKGLFNHRIIKHKGASDPPPGSAARCPQCELLLDSQTVLKTHLRISHGPNRFVCSCFTNFSSLEELRQHKVEAGHQLSQRVKMGSVGPAVTRSRATRWKGNTAKSRKGPKDKTAKNAVKTCPVCKEDVPMYGHALYKHHEREHPGVPYESAETNPAKNYLCDECGKSYISPTMLADHKNSHTGARPYLCPECPRAFGSAITLAAHEARHRPPTHGCNFCGKLFKSKSNLYCHERIHINDRRYKCHLCSANFIHAASLREHIRGVHEHQRRKRKNRKKEEK